MRLYRVTATIRVDMMVLAEDAPQARSIGLDSYAEQYAYDDPKPHITVTPVVSALNPQLVVPPRWFDRVPWAPEGANDRCATVRELVEEARP